MQIVEGDVTIVILCVVIIETIQNPFQEHSSDDKKIANLPGEIVNIPDYKGIPRRL